MTVATVDTLEVAGLIVESLNLEVGAQQIKPDEPLFYDGLGLDSIDALELALAVSRKYGFEMTASGPNGKEPFQSLRALADHIARNRTR
jgi:acyl carrier protein